MINGQLSFNILTEEAATGGVLSENVFLEISQNSQENTFARDSSGTGMGEVHSHWLSWVKNNQRK